MTVDLPVLKGFNIVGGISLTPEFAAMLVGLAVYYAANIAEIVRSGLQSVTHGQWEAGRALGLHRTRVLQLVVLPQAMRVITPLMTSTYLDLTKDTTLGVLIGFTEVTAVIKTSANNTGNAVETILVLVAVFLSISLPVSAAINAYNRVLARRGVVDVMTILLEGAQLAQPKTERWRRGRGRALLLAGQRRGYRRRRRRDRRWRFGSSPVGLCSMRRGRAGRKPADARSGACWPFVRSNVQLMLFGVYPQDLLWRPTVSLVLMAGVIVASMIPRLWSPAARARAGLRRRRPSASCFPARSSAARCRPTNGAACPSRCSSG